LKCDSFLVSDDYGIIIAFEHAATLSVTKNNSNSNSIHSHLYYQAECYDYFFKQNNTNKIVQTLLIHWTTVAPRVKEKEEWFPKSEFVKVVHIFHDENFEKFRIYDSYDTYTEVMVSPPSAKRKRDEKEEKQEKKITVTVRRLGTRGGVLIQLSATLEDLKSKGGAVLNIEVAKVRTQSSEAEIRDIDLIKADDILILTTQKEEDDNF